MQLSDISARKWDWIMRYHAVISASDISFLLKVLRRTAPLTRRKVTLYSQFFEDYCEF